MTDRTRLRLEISLLAIIFGGGAGWGAFTVRFNAFDARLTGIEQRVQAIYCATVPIDVRAGCR